MDLSLSPEEVRWQDIARSFAQNEVAPLARQMDEEGQTPPSLFARMAELGLLGGAIAKSDGGSGMNALSLVLVYEELGRACSSTRGFMTVHSSLVMQCIAQWGSAEQKAKYLPKLSKGELIGCYCLTEPEAGSDAASIKTHAVPSGDGYTLHGEKIWITNGNIASLGIVFAKLPQLEGEKPHSAITAFLVELNSAGIKREKMGGKELGHRASDHSHITFDGAHVTTAQVLGAERTGFKVAMSALDHGRLGVAAGALGVHQACLDATVDFVRKRKQFNTRIGDFEMIQSSVAEMKASLEASRGLVYKAAWKKDQGMPVSEDASIAKYFATEAALKAASDAVLIHGGRGYSNEYPVERYFRDIKGLQIYEGTSHIQRIVIARSVIGKP